MRVLGINPFLSSLFLSIFFCFYLRLPTWPPWPAVTWDCCTSLNTSRGCTSWIWVSVSPKSSLPRLGNSRLASQGTCLFLFQLGLRPNAKLGCWPGNTNGTLCISWESWPLAHVLPCRTIQALLDFLFISDPQRSKSVFLLFNEGVILTLSFRLPSAQLLTRSSLRNIVATFICF